MTNGVKEEIKSMIKLEVLNCELSLLNEKMQYKKLKCSIYRITTI